MAQTAVFNADFSRWNAALANAKDGLKSMEVSTNNVRGQLQRMANSFQGGTIIRQATLTAEAIKAVGGATTLTASEQQKANAVIQEAIQKYKVLGQQAPDAVSKIGAELKRLTQASGSFDGSAAKSLQGFREGTESSTGALATFGATFAAAFSAAAVAGIGLAAKSVIELGGHLEDLSAQTGIGTTDLQTLGAVGKTVGLSLDEIAAAASQLSKRLAGGDAGATAAVQSLGLSVKNLISAGPSEAFNQIAAAVGNIENPMDRARIATELLGKAGAQAIPLLTGNLRELRQEAEDSGKVIDERTVKAMDDLGDAWTDLKTTGAVLLSDVIAPMAPALHKVAVAAAEVSAAIHKDIADQTNLIADSWKFLSDTIKNFPAAVLDHINTQFGGNFAAYAAAAEAAAKSTGQVSESTKGMVSSLDLAQNRLKAMRAEALTPLSDAQKGLVREFKDFGVSAKDIAEIIGSNELAVNKYVNSLSKSKSAQADASKAQRELTKELEAANKAADEYGKSLDHLDQVMSKAGILTERGLSKQLGDLIEILNEAAKQGTTAFQTAVKELADDFDKLGLKAEKSGFKINIVNDIFNNFAKKAGLASIASRQLGLAFTSLAPTLTSNTNLTRGQSAEFSAQIKITEKVADAYHAMGLKTQAELNATAANARKNYNIIVEAVGKTAPAAREAFKKVQEAEAEAAGKVKTDWGKTLDDLSQSFAQLAQVSGGSFAGIAKSIGTVVAAMSLANKASKQMKAGFDQIKGSFGHDDLGQATIDWGNLGQGIAAAATAAIAAAGAIAQATAEGSKAHRVLGGALAGAEAGAAFAGVTGGASIAIGAGIGALVGWARANNAAEQAAQDARIAIAQLGGSIQKTFGTMKLASQIAATFGVNLKEALARGGPEGAALLQSALETLQAKQDHLNDLLETYGIDWKKLGPAFQASHILQNVNQLNQDWSDLAGAGVPLDQIIGSMAGKINDFLADALRTGQKLPQQFEPIIEQLIRMGKITDQNARALLGLSTDAEVDFEAMQKVAEKYGISLAALGPKFQAAKIHSAAQDIIDDFQLLVENGANVGGVLDGMSDEISSLVQQAIKTGVTLPDTMKPWILQLQAAGKLVDANGDKLTDLSGLNFEKPLSKAVDDLISKLGELIDKLGDVYGAVDQIPNSIDVGVHYTSDGQIELPDGTSIPQHPDQTHGGGGGTQTGPPPGYGPPPAQGHAMGGVIMPTYAAYGKVIPFVRKGTDTVPAMLTPGERVLSVPQTQKIDQWLRGIDSNQWQKTGTDGGGETHITNNFHIHPVDGNGLENLVRKRIIPMLNDAERRNEGGRRSRLIRVSK